MQIIKNRSNKYRWIDVPNIRLKRTLAVFLMWFPYVIVVYRHLIIVTDLSRQFIKCYPLILFPNTLLPSKLKP